MSNITTAGNLSVSQNVAIGGNCIISGNLLPTGNLNLAGNLNATNLNINSLTLQAGAGPINLNSNPIYGVNNGYDFISYSPLVGLQHGMQMAGYVGGQLGYTSQNGPFPSPITPVIYWNDSDRVGINTTSPDVVQGLHVNGDFKVNYESFLCVGGQVGNVYIGNSSAIDGGILYINSNRPSDDTSSGSLVVTGGVAISNRLNVDGNITTNNNVQGNIGLFNRIITNGPYDLKIYTGTTDTIYINGDSSGDLRFNTANTTGKTYFDNGNVYIGNTTSSSGQLIVQPNIASTSPITGSVVVVGGVGIAGNLVISNAGNILANATTASISTSTGTIQCKGGIGVFGNINVGGNITTGSYVVSSRLVPNGSVDASLRVYSGTGFPLFLQNDSTGDIQFMENSTGTSRFKNGNVTIGNSTTTSGQLQVLSGLTSTTTGTGAVVITGGIGISGDVNVGGTINGVLTTTGNITANAHGFNYSTVPTLLNTQIGYKNLTTTSLGSTASGTYVYSTISLPIGTYIFSLLATGVYSGTSGTLRIGFMSGSGGTFISGQNMTFTVGASSTYGNSLTAFITISTAGVQYYGFANTQILTTMGLTMSLMRNA